MISQRHWRIWTTIAALTLVLSLTIAAVALRTCPRLLDPAPILLFWSHSPSLPPGTMGLAVHRPHAQCACTASIFPAPPARSAHLTSPSPELPFHWDCSVFPCCLSRGHVVESRQSICVPSFSWEHTARRSSVRHAARARSSSPPEGVELSWEPRRRKFRFFSTTLGNALHIAHVFCRSWCALRDRKKT